MFRLKQISRLLTSEWFIVIAILSLAIFFRFYQLDLIPGAFLSDEVVETADALDIQANGPRIFLTSNYGREPLFTHLLALAFYVWEPQAIVLRAIGALAGTFAVAATYFLVKEMFKVAAPAQARWIAVLTSLGLATSYWQIHHTRMGLRHTLLPLMMTLVFYFMWRGLQSGKRAAFVWAGLLLGGSLYTYPAARFIPVFIVVFFAVEGIMRRLGRQEGLWRKHWQNLSLMVILALLVFTPLASYFLFTAPEQFARRASRISILNENLNQGSPWMTLAESVIGNLAGLAFRGDQHGNYNLPGRPIFDPILAIVFFIGLILALQRLRYPPYLFALLWWPIMMLPAFLVSDWVPTFKRAIGIAPGIYIFPALAWILFSDYIIRWGRQRHGRQLRLIYTGLILAPMIAFALITVQTYRDYFLIWGPSDPQYFHRAAYQKIARQIEQAGPADAVWIFPTDRRNKLRLYNYTDEHFFDFLWGRRLPARVLIRVDEEKMFDKLSAAVRGYSEVVLVDVKKGYEWEADHKNIFPFLLEKYGDLTKVYTSPEGDYDLLYYRLNSPDIAFQAVEQWQPVRGDFGGFLRLTEIAYGDASGANPPNTGQVPSGETLWAALHWQALEPMPADYQVSLRLVNATGQVVGKLDKPLANVWHAGSAGWQPEEKAIDYYLLPVEPGTMPGDYRLEVRIYSPADLQPLPLTSSQPSGNSFQAGPIRVTPALVPPALAPEVEIRIFLTPELRLNGYDHLPSFLRPGDKFNLALFWQSVTRPDKDFFLDLSLVGQNSKQSLLTDMAGSKFFPAGRWREGEQLKQWLTVQLPADLAPGDYDLRLSLRGTVTAVVLGRVQVQDYARLFELPTGVQHPLDTIIGSQIKLAGFDLDTPNTGSLTLRLYWQALSPLSNSYTVFVHILDQDGNIVAQRDQLPMAGQSPTTGWLPGEIIVDDYTFEGVPAVYQIAVGLYDSVTGQRLAIPTTSDNRLFLEPK